MKLVFTGTDGTTQQVIATGLTHDNAAAMLQQARKFYFHRRGTISYVNLTAKSGNCRLEVLPEITA